MPSARVIFGRRPPRKFVVRVARTRVEGAARQICSVGKPWWRPRSRQLWHLPDRGRSSGKGPQPRSIATIELRALVKYDRRATLDKIAITEP